MQLLNTTTSKQKYTNNTTIMKVNNAVYIYKDFEKVTL